MSAVTTEARTAKARAGGSRRTGGARREVVRRRGSRAVGSTYTRVVLRATPGETDARVTNWVALHLVDSHFGSVAMDKLDEATALAGRNLDVGDLSESLEERAQLILSNVARQATNKDGRVVRVGELVHHHRIVSLTALLITTETLLLLRYPGVGHAWLLNGSSWGHHLVASKVLELASLVATIKVVSAD